MGRVSGPGMLGVFALMRPLLRKVTHMRRRDSLLGWVEGSGLAYAAASLVLGLTLVIGGEATAAVQIASSQFYKVVSAGQRVKIASYSSIDPTCRSLGTASVNLLREPQGGTVETLRSSDFPTFVQANVRSACNRRRVPSTLLFYRAGPSFTGVDSFDVEVSYPDGFARKYRYALVVR